MFHDFARATEVFSVLSVANLAASRKRTDRTPRIFDEARFAQLLNGIAAVQGL
jgi:hypothetical protein